MNREIHVPLREGLGVKFPRATRPPIIRIRNTQLYTRYLKPLSLGLIKHFWPLLQLLCHYPGPEDNEASHSKRFA